MKVQHAEVIVGLIMTLHKIISDFIFCVTIYFYFIFQLSYVI